VRVQQITQFVNVGQIYFVARLRGTRLNIGQWLAQLSTFSMYKDAWERDSSRLSFLPGDRLGRS
jgi:hypothetical protein